MNFESEQGEDRWLMENHGDFFRTPQYYVDLGCAHPVERSQTCFLRQLGWRGLNIDAEQYWEQFWGSDFTHAIVSPYPEVHFAQSHAPCLSRVEQGPPNTPAVTLESLLWMAGVDKVGFMSIDVEGHEFEVLNSFDLHKYEPHFIVAEYNTHGRGEDFRVKEYLEKQGYETIHQTFSNLIYKRK